MLRHSDNPLQHIYQGHLVKFTNVAELCMGGPDTGYLLLDGIILGKNRRFGTNIIFYKDYLIVPRYKHFWSRFKLCAVHLPTRKTVELGRAEPLAMASFIEDNTLYYQNSLSDLTPQALSLANLL